MTYRVWERDWLTSTKCYYMRSMKWTRFENGSTRFSGGMIILFRKWAGTIESHYRNWSMMEMYPFLNFTLQSCGTSRLQLDRFKTCSFHKRVLTYTWWYSWYIHTCISIYFSKAYTGTLQVNSCTHWSLHGGGDTTAVLLVAQIFRLVRLLSSRQARSELNSPCYIVKASESRRTP